MRPPKNTEFRGLFLFANFGAAIAILSCGQDVFLIVTPTGTSAFSVTASTDPPAAITHRVHVTLSVMR